MDKKRDISNENIFPLDFAKYVSYSEVRKNRKVVNIWIRFQQV